MSKVLDFVLPDPEWIVSEYFSHVRDWFEDLTIDAAVWVQTGTVGRFGNRDARAAALAAATAVHGSVSGMPLRHPPRVFYDFSADGPGFLFKEEHAGITYIVRSGRGLRSGGGWPPDETTVIWPEPTP